MAQVAGQVGAAALQGVPFLLNAIGFTVPEQRERIIEAGLGEFEDFRYLNDKDIRDMAEEFAKRSIPNGRIIFGLGRTKKLVGIMHWIQDCHRTNDEPDIENFNDEALAEAQSRALVRKSDIDLVDTNTKAADPGKFKDERKWPEWEKAFTNYLYYNYNSLISLTLSVNCPKAFPSPTVRPNDFPSGVERLKQNIYHEGVREAHPLCKLK
jgi:hypothetical protein